MKKTLSFLLALSLAVEPLALAAPVIAPQPSRFEVLKPQVSFVFPASVATIDDAYQAGERTVVLMQDAHLNPSGQMNLAKALDIVLDKESIDTVYVESAQEDNSLSYLKPYYPAEVRREVAAEFVRKGKLHGTEYLNLTKENGDFTIWGVEDEGLYWDSVSLYREVTQVRQDALHYLKKVRRTANAIKPRIYDTALLALDEARERFEENKIDVAEYAKALFARPEIATADFVKRYPNLALLKTVIAAEESIDFGKAREEQEKFFQTLSEEERLNIENTAGEDAEVKEDERIRLYFTALEKAMTAKFSANATQMHSDYPELSKYFDYLKFSQEVDPRLVHEELSLAETAVYDALASTLEAKLLAEYDRHVRILQNLFELKATPQDFARYVDDPVDFDIQVITGFLNRKLMDLGSYHEYVLFLDDTYASAIQKSEAFYKLTYSRDRAFLDNMLERMDAANQDKAILVTGGFHTPHLKDLLKRRGISYVSVLPHVTEETDHTRYEKMLLDQISNEAKTNTINTQYAAVAGARLAELVNGLNSNVAETGVLQNKEGDDASNELPQIYPIRPLVLESGDFFKRKMVLKVIDYVREKWEEARKGKQPLFIGVTSPIHEINAQVLTNNLARSYLGGKSYLENYDQYNLSAEEDFEGKVLPFLVHLISEYGYRTGIKTFQDPNQVTFSFSADNLISIEFHGTTGLPREWSIFPESSKGFDRRSPRYREEAAQAISTFHSVTSRTADYMPTEKKQAARLAGNVEGVLFQPRQSVLENDPSIYKGTRTNEEVRKLLREAKEKGQKLVIRMPLRGIDGPGSSLDLPEFQVALVGKNPHALSEIPSTPTLASEYFVEVSFEFNEEAKEILYVAPDYGILPERPAIWIDKAAEFEGRVMGGQKAAPAYIFNNLFGLSGIKITVESISPIALAGGMESSNAFNVALFAAASMLKGADWSLADIFYKAVQVENNELKGLTGGQGHLSSMLGGAWKHTWLSGIQDESGESLFGYSAFSIPFLSEEGIEFVESHAALVQPGKEYKNGEAVVNRTAELINVMWTDLLRDKDRVGLELHSKKLALADAYVNALASQDAAKVVEVVNAYRRIRDELQKRWFLLALDSLNDFNPKYPYATRYAKRLKEDKVLKQYYLKYGERLVGISLYSDSANNFIAQAEKEGIAIFPLGAGGPGANMLAFSSKPDVLADFFARHGIPVFDEYSAREIIHGTGVLNGYSLFKVGREGIRYEGFEELGLTAPAMPEPASYDPTQFAGGLHQPTESSDEAAASRLSIAGHVKQLKLLLEESRTQTQREWEKTENVREVHRVIYEFIKQAREEREILKNRPDAVDSVGQTAVQLQILRGISYAITFPHLYRVKKLDRLAKRNKANLKKLWIEMGTQMERERVLAANQAVLDAGRANNVKKTMEYGQVHFAPTGEGSIVDLNAAEIYSSYEGEVYAPWMTNDVLSALIMALPVELDASDEIRIPAEWGQVSMEKLNAIVMKNAGGDTSAAKRLLVLIGMEKKLRSSVTFVIGTPEDPSKGLAAQLGISIDGPASYKALAKDLYGAINFLKWVENWENQRQAYLNGKKLEWVRSIQQRLSVKNSDISKLSEREFAARIISLNYPEQIIEKAVENTSSVEDLKKAYDALRKGRVSDHLLAGGTASRWKASLEELIKLGYVSEDEVPDNLPRALAAYWLGNYRDGGETGFSLALKNHLHLAAEGNSPVLSLTVSPYTFEDFIDEAWKLQAASPVRTNLRVVLQNPGVAMVIDSDGILTNEEIPDRVLGHGNVRDYFLALIDDLKAGITVHVAHNADNPFSRINSPQILQAIQWMFEKGLVHIGFSQRRSIGQSGGGYIQQNGNNQIVDVGLTDEVQPQINLFNLFINVMNLPAMLYAVTTPDDGLISWQQVQNIIVNQSDEELSELGKRLEALDDRKKAELVDRFMKLLPTEFVVKDTIYVQWEQISGMLHGTLEKAVSKRLINEGNAEALQSKLVGTYVDASLADWQSVKNNPNVQVPTSVFVEAKSSVDKLIQEDDVFEILTVVNRTGQQYSRSELLRLNDKGRPLSFEQSASRLSNIIWIPYGGDSISVSRRLFFEKLRSLSTTASGDPKKDNENLRVKMEEWLKKQTGFRWLTLPMDVLENLIEEEVNSAETEPMAPAASVIESDTETPNKNSDTASSIPLIQIPEKVGPTPTPETVAQTSKRELVISYSLGKGGNSSRTMKVDFESFPAGIQSLLRFRATDLQLRTVFEPYIRAELERKARDRQAEALIRGELVQQEQIPQVHLNERQIYAIRQQLDPDSKTSGEELEIADLNNINFGDGARLVEGFRSFARKAMLQVQRPGASVARLAFALDVEKRLTTVVTVEPVVVEDSSRKQASLAVMDALGVVGRFKQVQRDADALVDGRRLAGVTVQVYLSAARLSAGEANDNLFRAKVDYLANAIETALKNYWAADTPVILNEDDVQLLSPERRAYVEKRFQTLPTVQLGGTHDPEMVLLNLPTDIEDFVQGALNLLTEEDAAGTMIAHSRDLAAITAAALDMIADEDLIVTQEMIQDAQQLSEQYVQQLNGVIRGKFENRDDATNFVKGLLEDLGIQDFEPYVLKALAYTRIEDALQAYRFIQTYLAVAA